MIITAQFDQPQTKTVAFNALEKFQVPLKILYANKLRDKLLATMAKQRSFYESCAVFEELMPYYFALDQALENKTIPANLITYSWTSALLEENKSGILGSKKKEVYTDSSFKFELFMMCWNYGFAIVNYAAELIKSSGEVQVVDKVKDAAALLRKAAGVFDYLAQENMLKNSTLLSTNASLKELPEMYHQTALAMSSYCVAIAHVVAVHQAVQTNKSNGLIGKLAISVYRFMDSARISCNAVCDNLSSSKQTFSETLRALIAQYRVLYRSEALHYLARDAYTAQKYGLAVGYISVANKQLHEMKPFKDLKNNAPFMREVKRISDVTVPLEEKYILENTMVFREKVIEYREFDIPENVNIMKPIPYIAPVMPE